MSTKSIQKRKPLRFVSDFPTTLKIVGSEKVVENHRAVSKSKKEVYDFSKDGKEKITFYDLLLENQIETGAIDNASIVQMQSAGIDEFSRVATDSLSQLKHQENEES